MSRKTRVETRETRLACLKAAGYSGRLVVLSCALHLLDSASLISVCFLISLQLMAPAGRRIGDDFVDDSDSDVSITGLDDDGGKGKGKGKGKGPDKRKKDKGKGKAKDVSYWA